MKLRTIPIIFGVLAALCMLPSLTYGDVVSVTFGDTNGAYMGGVYTDPYYGHINGGGLVDILCDDYYDHIGWGETWSASRISFSQIAASGLTTPPLFLGTSGEAGYIAAGWLAVHILNGTDIQTNDGVADARYESWAMWQILDPSHVPTPGDGNPNILADLKSQALSIRLTPNDPYFSNLELLTPIGGGSNGDNWSAYPDGRPQEMFTAPEALGLPIPGLGMAGLIALHLVLRRRVRRQE